MLPTLLTSSAVKAPAWNSCIKGWAKAPTSNANGMMRKNVERRPERMNPRKPFQSSRAAQSESSVKSVVESETAITP